MFMYAGIRLKRKALIIATVASVNGLFKKRVYINRGLKVGAAGRVSQRLDVSDVSG